MRILCLVSLLLFFASPNLQAQKTKPFNVVFYNVENLFDTLNHPVKNDDEFTPSSEKKWTAPRYTTKLNKLSLALSTAGGETLPSAIGLCEVENRKVVVDLLKTDKLRKGKYKIIHYESPDFRGIDCAFAYRKKHLKVLSHRAIPVTLADTSRTTRDILYVKGLAYKKDTVHFFVNHWPSRYGGQEKSEPKRLRAAYVLRVEVEKIMKRNPKAKIVIMGDFNDYPQNKSMTETLSATPNPTPSRPQDLFNLMSAGQDRGEGSYNYRGNWGMLDQIVVSYPLLQASIGLIGTPDCAQPVKEEFMLYTNPDNGEQKPNRTYGGNRYYGGYSDHLPVRATLVFVKKR